MADTYIVCLDCGFEMPYSWNEMRVYKERRKARRRRARPVAALPLVGFRRFFPFSLRGTPTG